MKKIKYILLLIGIISGCKSNKLYFESDVAMIQDGYFKFNMDSTFYYQKNGIGFKHSEGLWKKVADKTFLLKSYAQDKTLPVILNETALYDSIESHLINVSVKVDKLIPETIQFYKVILVVNDSIIKESPVNSPNFKINRLNLRSLKVGITGTENIPTRMFDTLFTKNVIINGYDKKNYMKFQIDCNDTLFNYVIFDSFRFQLFSRKINFNKYYVPLVRGVRKLKLKKGAAR